MPLTTEQRETECEALRVQWRLEEFATDLDISYKIADLSVEADYVDIYVEKTLDEAATLDEINFCLLRRVMSIIHLLENNLPILIKIEKELAISAVKTIDGNSVSFSENKTNLLNSLYAQKSSLLDKLGQELDPSMEYVPLQIVNYL